MKVHQFTCGGGFWGEESCGLTLSVRKQVHPLNSKLTSSGNTQTCFTMNDIRDNNISMNDIHDNNISSSCCSNSSHATTAFNLRNFLRPKSYSTDQLVSPDHKKDFPRDECHPGGTRWNPTQEQIRILEILYRGGMRSPNVHQIEQITSQLSKYGKIEGKNVFYWFQNHKARERQKQKRNNLGLTRSPRSTPSSTMINSISPNTRGEVVESPCKKCKSWSSESLDQKDEEDDKTLELFPLHPEGRSRSS